MKSSARTALSGRLFKSGFLELFSRTHPLVILAIYIPLCGLSIWYFYNYVQPSWIVLSLVFLFGLFSWTFAEYILHRFVFHWVGESKFIQRFHYIIHGVHHAYPRDKQRLVMPPVPSLLLALLLFFFFRALWGNYVFAFFAGFVIGYLIYACIHYATHALRPPKGRLRFLWQYHAIHHYKHSDKAFGVSSPLWDYVFGTVPPEKFKSSKFNVQG